MAHWAIIVEFETVDGREAEFVAILSEHARRTREEEPGCLRFEVMKPVARNGEPIANRVIANELYVDEAAVAAHESNPRMASVGAAVAPLLADRRLILAATVWPAATGPDEGLRPSELNAANDG